MRFKIALLQILPGANQKKNLEKGIKYCRKAKELGADLVLFPEKWEEKAIDQQSEFFQAFVNLAKELEINIAITYLEKYSLKPRNTVSLIDKLGQ